MNISGKKKYIPFVAIPIFLFVGFLLIPGRDYRHSAARLPASFDEYYKSELAEAVRDQARPGTEPKMLSFSPGKAKVAFLYIHGFKASRAEGEAVMDNMAQKFRASIYYLRLPGHGTNMEDQAARSYSEYLDESENALQMVSTLGEKVIVVGTSMGGLIATYLAAQHPDTIAGLILASPFFEPVNPLGDIAAYPGGIWFMETVRGTKIWDTSINPKDPSDRRLPGYEKYWYVQTYYAAVRPLIQMKNFINRPSTIARVTVPVELFYYYKDEANQDGTASVPAMLDTFSHFGGTRAHALNRSFAVANGNHVMLSKWVPTDKEFIEKRMEEFINDILLYNTHQ